MPVPPMALTSHRIPCIPTRTPPTHHHPLRRGLLIPSPQSIPHRRTTTIVSASKKPNTSRTGKFDSKKRRGSSVSTKDEEEDGETGRAAYLETGPVGDAGGAALSVDDGFEMPKLPGEERDFWEGPQWDALGFFVQYMWAFGIVFALISSGIAVATYNEGATDFKDTTVYKEAIQSRDLLEEPEGSNSEVFESNPTEQAPSVE